MKVAVSKFAERLIASHVIERDAITKETRRARIVRGVDVQRFPCVALLLAVPFKVALAIPKGCESVKAE